MPAMSPNFDLRNGPKSARIVVAMSGGVDSSVVAALAAQTGAEVIGVTLQLYDHGEAVKRTGSCCAGQDIYDAKTVCDRLGIAHYVLDYESRFRTGVIDKFADEYAAGRTPVPCSLCNQGVKFVDLIAFARELGADCLATGHYVRRVEREGRVELWKGRDPARDQSYFLYGTTADQLDFLRFPLGRPAQERGAPAGRGGRAGGRQQARQPGHLLRPRRRLCQPGQEAAPRNRRAGRDRRRSTAKCSAQHQGVVHFTIGQRRGIEVGGQKEPLYVVRIEPETQRLVVGPRRALAVGAAQRRGHQLARRGPDRGRSQGALDGAGRSRRSWDGERLTFATPEYGVAPGQSAVFYDGERLLGGGTIVATEAAVIDEAVAA